MMLSRCHAMRSRAVVGSITNLRHGCTRLARPSGVARSAHAATMVQQLEGPTEVTAFITDLNVKYEKVKPAVQTDLL